MGRKISVVIEKDENGYYAYAPELKGCQTQGQTLDDTLTNIREAVELYLDTLDDDERTELSSLEILTTSVEVPLA
jgi:predicted RNase H-like HicB family nuclease